jgi:ribonuclease G
MNKEMIISSNGHETRVAILEDDQLAELFVEREQNRGVVGNVYKGRVSKVLPGMQSSFVDIGLERDGFLYVSDVIANLDEYEKDDEDDDGAKSARVPTVPMGPMGPKARRRPMVLPARDLQAPPERRGRDRRERRDRDDEKRAPEPKIEELLKEGQDVIVQVAKEPLGTKGARLTCHVTLPGRFLVFMPTVDHIGISRKIDSRDERSRLRGIVKEFREQHSFSGGVIIRTAASGRSKEDILADLNYFYKIWVDMRQRGEQRRSPVTVYQEPEPRRQAAARSVDRRLHRDPHRQSGRASARAGVHRPHHADLGKSVKRYDKDFPIFEEYGVQAELDKALRSKVWLKSGGSIVINQTEALVAIDVNTGRYVGKKTAGRSRTPSSRPTSKRRRKSCGRSPARSRRHHRLRLH